MTPTQKLQVAQSENRSKIAGILDTEEDKREKTWQSDLEGLTNRAQSLELELRAALVAGEESTEEKTEKTTESTEDLERREPEKSIGFEPYVRAAMSGHGVASGPEAEFNQEFGLSSEQFPLELLTRGDDLGDLEKRASIDGDAKVNQGGSWIDRLFSDTAAQRLGVTFPSVAPGVAAYPVTTGGGEPVQRGREQAAAAGVYTKTVTELKPTRNAVHGVYSIEDNARLPGLADAIGRDMRAAMVEKIDRTIFVGDTGADENTADIAGLTTATGITEITLTQANKVMGLEWLKLFAALMDGKHAASEADLNIVLSVGANQLLLSTRELAAVSSETMARFLRGNGITWSTRGEIDTTTDNNKFGAFIGLKRGQAGTAVAPVWSAATLIRDPYSGAKSGEVQLTLSYLWAFGIPRADNYRRLKFVT